MTDATKFTLHSFRAYFACALMASGHSVGEIQALARWRSPKSVAIYATLSAEAYEAHIRRASRADVSAKTVDALWARRPTVDADEHVCAMADFLANSRDRESSAALP